MRVFSRTVVPVFVAAAVAVLPLLVSAPSSAATRGHTGSHAGSHPESRPGSQPGAHTDSHTDSHRGHADPCETEASATRQAGGSGVPQWRKGADTRQVTRQDVQALPARETRAGIVARQVEPRLPNYVVIPVHAHVIKGKHRGERPKLRPKRIRKMLQIMNNAMARKQSSHSAWSRYRFVLKKVTTTRNDRWFHAAPNSAVERKMRRKLHRGNARTLNIYFGGTGAKNNPLLGWARFPWQAAYAPKQDGLAVSVKAIPGGSARGYNLGDTLIHETGHWLGLFHTFQGGCEGSGDSVADTPAEAEPSYYCPTTRDTCPAPGLDPVRNFMDFSLDSCMNMFTRGQVLRMDAAFVKYRY